MKICSYCKWKILEDDLSRVIVDDEVFHTACFNYNEWLGEYHKRLFGDNNNNNS